MYYALCYGRVPGVGLLYSWLSHIVLWWCPRCGPIILTVITHCAMAVSQVWANYTHSYHTLCYGGVPGVGQLYSQLSHIVLLWCPGHGDVICKVTPHCAMVAGYIHSAVKIKWTMSHEVSWYLFYIVKCLETPSSTVQYNVVLCSTNNTVRYCSVQCCALQCITVHYSTNSTVEYCSVQYSAV